MKPLFRILSLVTLFTIQMNVSFADRGLGKKRNKVILNIKSPNNFMGSLRFNLKHGLKYSGIFINNAVTTTSTSFNYLVTYQKGNSVYLLPYKQKILTTDTRQGYTGAKLIIKFH